MLNHKILGPCYTHQKTQSCRPTTVLPAWTNPSFPKPNIYWTCTEHTQILTRGCILMWQSHTVSHFCVENAVAQEIKLMLHLMRDKKSFITTYKWFDVFPQTTSSHLLVHEISMKQVWMSPTVNNTFNTFQELSVNSRSCLKYKEVTFYVF